MRELELDRIEDPIVRENFRRLKDLLAEPALLRGKFTFFEFTLAALTYPATHRIRHGLSFTPQDVIQTSTLGTGTITWNYAKFDSSYLYCEITGPMSVRAFIGSYQEGSRA